MADTPRGHCWNCREPANKPILCLNCQVGEYCSSQCRQHDLRRHMGECLIFGPRVCCYCLKMPETLLECTCCSEGFFCNKTCQRKGWKSHKEHCHMVKLLILCFTENWRNHLKKCRGNTRMLCMMDLSFYFGNSIASDFLNLKENEWQIPYSADDPCLQKEFFILSVGCGDVRNLVNTIASLPEEFAGKLHVTMCDFDPFVMARNVLLLYMMVKYSDEPDFEKTFTTIWYSLQMSQHDYRLLDKALETLLAMASHGQSLLQLTNGLLDMPSKQVHELRQVWERWYAMECAISHPNSISLYEGRRLMQRGHSCDPYTKIGIPVKQLASYEKWWDDGIFAPSVCSKDELPFYNPIMTGRPGADSTCQSEDPDEKLEETTPEKLSVRKEPRYFDFVYCISSAASPFGNWDYVKVEKMDFDSSIVVQHHIYVSNVVGRAIRCIQEKNAVSIKMTTVEFHDLKEDANKFDRIFLSNLPDYHGIHKLVSFFGPWLKRENKYSAIAMEALNSDIVSEPDGLVTEGWYEFETNRWKTLCIWDEMEFGMTYLPRYRDYGYDADWYLRWMKARYKVENQSEDDFSIPSSRTVLRCGDFRMRDIRKERNRLIPFFYQGAVRKGGIPARRMRAFEWVYADD